MNGVFYWRVTLLSLVLGFNPALSFLKAQDVGSFQVQGNFLKDSVAIGLSVQYKLKITYPSHQQILFPDSAYNYAPFEFVKRYYYPTQSQDSLSTDSVVYNLTTFEIDKIQTLQLPIYIIQDQDCTLVWAETDTVFLQELVQGAVEELSPQKIVNYQEVPHYFNYPLIISVLVVILIVLLVLWGILGGRIRQVYALFQSRTRHAVFLKDFARLSSRAINAESTASLERAIGLWKKHLEYFENAPYSTYTSTEIKELIPDEQLALALKNIDRAIYGKEFSEKLEKDLLILRSFSIDRFEKKQEELRNV